MASMGFASITGSGFLAAFALMLGADNLQIGLLAALPFLAMPLQVATVGLVERLRRRKAIAVVAMLSAQTVWIPIALIPVFAGVPSPGAVSLLLGLIAIRSVFVAIQNTAWNSWLRDLVPQERMGRFFAQRLAYARVAAMVFGMGAAIFVDVWKGRTAGETEALGYTYAILFGALFLGLASPLFRALVPEPLMETPPGGRAPLLRTLMEPFRDENYRHLLRFQFFWFFALHLAIPFFAVYMLVVLDLPLSLVMGLSVLGMASNVLFLRLWGPLADQVGHKVVLQLTASLYLLVVLGWMFTTMPDRYFLTLPLLVVLHILAGAAAAGVDVSAGTLGLKLAPRGRSTGYLAAMSIAVNLGAGIGPLVGGGFVDFFSTHTVGVNFTWQDQVAVRTLPAVSLTGYDFLFGIAFVVGLITLAGLTALREEGEVSRELVLESLRAPMQRLTSPISSVPGVGWLAQFPFGYLRRVPVPGFDVALGITAYEVAEGVRVATAGAARGRAATTQAANAVEHTVDAMWHAGERVEAHAADLARHAARGAAHAAAGAGAASGRVLHQALHGIVRAMARHPILDPEEMIGAIAYGAVQGSVEAGADPAEAVRDAVAAFDEATASSAGIAERQAAAYATDAAMKALEELAPHAADQVRVRMPPEDRPENREDG